MKAPPKDHHFDKLLMIVAQLRDPETGCPWDREQTHASLKPYVIEEAFEVVEAIDAGPSKLCSELGDLLLQVALHSQIADEAGTFSITVVLDRLIEKLISRHPHVFGDVSVKDTSDVLKNWEEIKQRELPAHESILDGVPKGMPALLRALRIGEKAARVGFEWSSVGEIKDKVLEEIAEFAEVSINPSTPRERIEDELGDVLFAISQLARRLNLNAEDLLQRSSDKFVRRFKAMEKRAGGSLKQFSLEELDQIWEQVKSEERSS